MQESCVAFALSDTVPTWVTEFVERQNRLVIKGFYRSIQSLEPALEASPVQHILIDAVSSGSVLPALLAAFGGTHRLLLIDPQGAYSINHFDLNAARKSGKGSKEAIVNTGSSTSGLRLEIVGKAAQSLRDQLDAGHEPIKLIVEDQDVLRAEAVKSAIFVRFESRISRIALQDLIYVEAQKDYVVIHATTGVYRILGSMKRIAAELGEEDFFRVHRSFIIRLDKIDRIEGEDMYLKGASEPVPVGPSYRSLLLRTLRMV